MTKPKLILSILLLSASLSILWAELMPSPQYSDLTEQQTTLPDGYMMDIVVRHYDQGGQLRQQLQAKLATHTPYGNVIHYDHPQITLLSTTGNNWQLSADGGASKQGKEIIELEKQVRLFRPGSQHNPETLATTNKLTANTDLKTLSTHDTVRIEQPNLVITGTGLQGDLKSGELHTLSNTKTTFKRRQHASL